MSFWHGADWVNSEILVPCHIMKCSLTIRTRQWNNHVACDLTLPQLCLALSCRLLELLASITTCKSIIIWSYLTYSWTSITHPVPLFSVLACATRISCAVSVLGALWSYALSGYKVHVLPRCDTGCSVNAVETWPVKQKEVHTLETFHHHCLRTLLGHCRFPSILVMRKWGIGLYLVVFASTCVQCVCM